jgi:DNA-binding MarR family transcriptional regulator
VLRLTERGREVYGILVPKVLDLEERLLNGLTTDERKTLLTLMEKVRLNAIANDRQRWNVLGPE